jgi:molybdenum cofactor biosynthesis protein A
MKHNTPILTDAFGRKHTYLRISLTERCNLRCFYCMPEEGIELRDKSDFMTSEEVLTIAKTFVKHGVTKIRLTGGEPLLKKNFSNILLQLAQLPVELAITTNAVLLDKYMDLLAECGVKKLNISLDSLKRDRMNTIARRPYFDRIIDNIQTAIDKDFHVKINIVLIKGVNDDEIIDFIEWTKDRNVSIRFIEFMPFQGNNWDASQKISHKEIMHKVHSYFGEDNTLRIEDEQNDTSKNYRIARFKGSFGVISSVTNPFCDTCNRIRLTADGKIKNCLFSKTETNLLEALRSNQNIEELIQHAVFSKKKERGGYSAAEFGNKNSMRNRSMTTIGG